MTEQQSERISARSEIPPNEIQTGKREDNCGEKNENTQTPKGVVFPH
jgi:hypothetical protein|tara:strand:- start:1125 stop:1265 length:141 start_codon:yes stop_codon:yes gene_type:complete